MVGAKSVETDVLMGNPRSFAAEIVRKGRDRFVDAIVIPHRQVRQGREREGADGWWRRAGVSCPGAYDMGRRFDRPSHVCVCVGERTQGIYFMADSYEHFLKEMVIKSDTTVVLLVNPAASTHNILPIAGACVRG